MKEIKVDPESLKEFSTRVFEKMGCNKPDASLAAEVLLSADLRGVDSHGVARLSGYLRLYEKGRVNSKPNFRVVHETPSTAVLDADGALGLVSAPYAMELAMQKAEKVGTGWVSVRNSNHFGIAGYHTMKALQKDMIGIALTNASPLVAPTFSKERLLGTNPISVAIPAGEERAFVADMATTTAANGKLEILQRKGIDAPSGWIQDADGHPTTDAHGVKKGGALLPLGGDRSHGSHKGYALGAMVDIFSAVLSGANYGPWVPPFVAFLEPPSDPVGEGIGHFLGAMRVDAFRPSSEFKQHMDQWIRRFSASEPVHGQTRVMIPGDPEREMEEERKQFGIPLLQAVWDDLTEMAQRFDLSLPTKK